MQATQTWSRRSPPIKRAFLSPCSRSWQHRINFGTSSCKDILTSCGIDVKSQSLAGASHGGLARSSRRFRS